MAIRNDFTIYWETSPRVILIAAPSVECTMQDLYDTLRYLEFQTNAMDDSSIVDASGKEPLGGGTKVGLTVSLQNAVVGFEARDGLPLKYNPITEQMDNTWTFCDLSGGNLVAFDTDGSTTINPLFSTDFVNIGKTSSASATLQEQDALNYASYGGQASLDAVKGQAGTTYPVGNQEYPVDNAADAVIICHGKGFHQIGVRNDYYFDLGDNISDLRIQGVSHVTTNIDLGFDAVCERTIFEKMRLSGILDGDSELNDCVVTDLVYFNGHIHNCGLNGTITLGGNKPAKISNCSMLDFITPVIIDAGGSGQDAIIDNWSGSITISNLTGNNIIGIGAITGAVTIDASCTGGQINISGNCDIHDYSNGSVVNTTGVVAHGHQIDALPETLADYDMSCPQ